MARVTASSGKKKFTTADVLHKKRSGDLPIPFADIEVGESIVTGFRQTMFDLSDDDGNEVATMATGSGYGTDFITMKWGDKYAVVRGVDLLRAWVATFDPEAAKAIPEGLS
jgi:hypothetical protein